MIYFIKEAGTRFVKVGYSRSEHGVKARLQQLQTSNPRTLSVVSMGSHFTGAEQWWHATLCKYHVRGEWYKLSIEQLDFVQKTNLLTVKSIQDILSIVSNSGCLTT